MGFQDWEDYRNIDICQAPNNQGLKKLAGQLNYLAQNSNPPISSKKPVLNFQHPTIQVQKAISPYKTRSYETVLYN